MARGDNDEERWDLYTESREITGLTHRRGDPMLPGEYRLAVHVIIFNSKNQLLIQKRQPWKRGWPNLWDLSVGGSATAGENSQMAAERETFEELGLEISLAGIRPHFTVNFEDGFDDYYFIQQEVDLESLHLQEDEVQDVAWVNEEEMLSLVERGEFIPYYFLDKLFEIRHYYGSIRGYQ